MKNLKTYIIESIKRSNNEAIDNFIYEGFLDKLKDAIEKIIDDPQKYFDVVREQFQEMKDSKHILYLLKKEPEKVAEEMDKLNNDEDLKKIYRYTKDVMSDEYGELCKSLFQNGKSVNIILDDIKKNFDNCDENKTFAILQIAMALGYAIRNEQRKQSDSSKKSSGSISKSSSNAGKMAAASAVAIALRR